MPDATLKFLYFFPTRSPRPFGGLCAPVLTILLAGFRAILYDWLFLIEVECSIPSGFK